MIEQVLSGSIMSTIKDNGHQMDELLRRGRMWLTAVDLIAYEI